MEKAVSRNLTV